MAIKVLIKRDFKAGNLKQVSQLLNRARYGAMGMKGYISSETLTDLKNPNRVVVVSMWQNLSDWDNWKSDPSRSELAAEMEKIMTGPETIEAYEIGMQFWA
jgi:heme-degrading monooxygenase HmoA